MEGLNDFKRFELFVEEVEKFLNCDFIETKRYCIESANRDSGNWEKYSDWFELYLKQKNDVLKEMVDSFEGIAVVLDWRNKFVGEGIKNRIKKTKLEKFCDMVVNFFDCKLVPVNKDFTRFKITKYNDEGVDKFSRINKTICYLGDELAGKDGWFKERAIMDLTSNKNIISNAVKYGAPQKNTNAEKHKAIESDELERAYVDVSISEINEDIVNVKKLIEEKRERKECVEVLNKRLGYLYINRKLAMVLMRKTIPYANVGYVQGDIDPDLIDYGNVQIVREVLKMCIMECYNFDSVMDIVKYEIWYASKGLSKKRIEIIKMLNDGYSNKEIAKTFGVSESAISQNIDTIAKKISEILTGNKNGKNFNKYYTTNLNYLVWQKY